MKKVKIALIVLLVLAVIGGGAAFVIRKNDSKKVDVFEVSAIVQQIWNENTSLDGNISSHVSQDVHLMEKGVVEEIYVQEGDEVTEGMPLISYDTTLVNIELEKEKLEKQKMELRKKTLEHEISELKKQTPVTARRGQGQNIGGCETIPVTSWTFRPCTAAITEPTPEETEPGSEEIEGTTPGEETDNPEEAEAKAYDRLYKDITLEEEEVKEEIENAVPYKGEGTEDDPYMFLCKKNVWIQGAFINWAAGFGVSDEKENEPVVCVLEVREEDKVSGRLLAAFLLDGRQIAHKREPAEWYETRLGDIVEENKNDENGNVDGDIGEYIPDGDIIGSYTQDELNKAIREKENEIKNLVLDMKESDLKIKSVEKKAGEYVVKSTVNGVVKKVGDPLKGEQDGEPFLQVESTQGVYVKGTISEYMLDRVQTGQLITGFAMESGLPVEAEIKEISPYPQEGGYYGWGREVSMYPFTAYIENGEGFKDMEYVSLQLPQEAVGVEGLYIEKKYVRSKDGKDFVFAEGKNGKLEKREVKTGKVFYGYLIEIKEGLEETDHIAFPYGKNVKEGVRIKRISQEEMYNGMMY